VSALVGALVLAVGAAVSIRASQSLVRRLDRLGAHLGLSEALIGLLTALAADAPEISSAVVALVEHNPDLGVGVILGSNVFNLAALIGLSCLVAGTIGLGRRALALSGGIALLTGGLAQAVVARAIAPGLALAGGATVLAAYVLLAAQAPERIRRWRLARRLDEPLAGAVEELDEEHARRAQSEREVPGQPPPDQPAPGDPAIDHPALGQPSPDQPAPGWPPHGYPAGGRRGAWLLLPLLATVVLASAAMVQAASSLGHHLGIPTVLVGNVGLAAITSLPNVVAALHLARQGRGPALASEAFNSNALNALFGFLLPAAILGLGSGGGGGVVAAAAGLVLTLVVVALAFPRRRLTRLSGGIVVAGYALFVAALVLR
jgi:cation:H+ antiporter